MELLEEQKLQIPGIETLRQTGHQVQKIVEEFSEDIDHTLKTSLELELDIFLADLDGELHHDYNKRNKRYKEKWIRQKSSLDQLIDRLKKSSMD